jgi:hypothetical protein
MMVLCATESKLGPFWDQIYAQLFQNQSFSQDEGRETKKFNFKARNIML